MSLANLIHKIWGFIKHLFDGLDEEVKKLLPIATGIVEKIKAFEDLGGGDIITELIPGNVDNILNDRLKALLPKIILEMHLVGDIANETDRNKQLADILSAIKLSPDDMKNAKYHAFGALILHDLADGKLTWAESVEIIEYYYNNFVKQPAPAESAPVAESEASDSEVDQAA